jgi:hypothetical protein
VGIETFGFRFFLDMNAKAQSGGSPAALRQDIVTDEVGQKNGDRKTGCTGDTTGVTTKDTKDAKKRLENGLVASIVTSQFGVDNWQKNLVAKKWSTDIRIQPAIVLPSIFLPFSFSNRITGRRN